MKNNSGNSLGGHNRAKALSDKERTDIAKGAANVRWEKEKLMPKATHRGELEIGDIKIPCAVLEDGSRVVTESGFVNVLGSAGGKQRKDRNTVNAGEVPLPLFLAPKALKPFVDSAFESGYPEQVFYKDGRKTLVGYQAKILPMVCEIWLKARDAGALQKQQLPKAFKAESLMRGLAQIGIVALVDEATGYQDERDRNELHKLLEIYLVEEKLTWAKRFPDEFYKQLYRLMGWSWPNPGSKRPGYVGTLTNKLVYDKLPKGVLEELQHRNPTKPGANQRKWKHHQFLSEDIGQADLRDHLLQLLAIMRISKNWKIFEMNFEAAFPESGQQIGMDI